MFTDLVGRNLEIHASGTCMIARFLNMNMARHDQIRRHASGTALIAQASQVTGFALTGTFRCFTS